MNTTHMTVDLAMAYAAASVVKMPSLKYDPTEADLEEHLDALWEEGDSLWN